MVTTDPTALYFNPAGIALGEGTRLYVSGVLALRRASWSHAQAASELPEPPGAEGADTGQARFSNLFGAPALAATTRLRRFALGGAFYVPFGGRVRWDQNPRFANDPAFPLAADGVQRWHLIEGAVTSFYFTVGAAVRLGPVALGVTGNLIRSSVHSQQAKSFNPQQVVDPLNEGRIGIDVAGTHASFGDRGDVRSRARAPLAGRFVSGAAGPGRDEARRHAVDQPGRRRRAAAADHLHARAAGHRARRAARAAGLWTSAGRRALELRLYGDLTRWSRLQTQCVSIQGEPCAVFPDGTDATPGATTIQNIRRRWNDTYGVEPGRQLLDVRRGRGVRGRRLRDRRHPRRDAGSDDAGRQQLPLRRWEVGSPSRAVFTSRPG